ncbi:MAG: 2Fe-2S iron-sulfur cluster-binding protein, partial [Halodesulfurarchaeum sp.]
MGSDPTVTFRPWDVEVDVQPGTTLLEAAERGDVGIEALCAGNGLCGTCAVQVEEDDPPLSPVEADERTVLAEAELAEGYR